MKTKIALYNQLKVKSMKIYLGANGLKNSWQKPFESTNKCSKCNGESRIMFVTQEEREGRGDYICDIRKNGGQGNYWPHDAIAVAVYLCKDCFNADAIINQA